MDSVDEMDIDGALQRRIGLERSTHSGELDLQVEIDSRSNSPNPPNLEPQMLYDRENRNLLNSDSDFVNSEPDVQLVSSPSTTNLSGESEVDYIDPDDPVEDIDDRLDERPTAPTPNEGMRDSSPIAESRPASQNSRSESLEDIRRPSQMEHPSTSNAVARTSRRPHSTEANPNSSLAEFETPKKMKIPTPKKKTPLKSDDEDGECCSICFESWTNSGSHRLASLKCGHLFGQSCIEKWLKGQGNKCPQCNVKAVKKDIRVIYAKALKMVDTSERDAALHALEAEKEARKAAELEAAQVRLRLQMALDESRRLKEELQLHQSHADHMRLNLSQSNKVPSASQISASHMSSIGKYDFEKVIKVCDKDPGSRVMVYNHHLATLCISQPSPNPLFPGFGVKKLSTLDLKTSQYVSVHSGIIRDLSVHPVINDGLLISASMDKTVKMTNLNSNTVVQTYTCPVPVWSCSWNLDDRNYFFSGQSNGVVNMYDMRNTAGHVEQFNTEGSRSPVVSLSYIPHHPGTGLLEPGGLVIGQLDRSTFMEKRGAQYKSHQLPLEGSLTSLASDGSKRHLLATYRPSPRHPYVRHELYSMHTELKDGDHICTCQSVSTFQGGSTQKFLARNKLLSAHEGARGLFACASDEAFKSVSVWDVGDGKQVQQILSKMPVIDICQVHESGNEYLMLLTEKELSIHKWKNNR